MKTLVAIPCLDMVHTKFVTSMLNLGFAGECELTLASGSLVYDARNYLAKKAVDEGFDRVLWLDSDMTFEPGLFMQLSKHLDEGKEFVSGLYFKRKKPIEPVIYKTCALGKDPEGRVIPVIESFTDYPVNSLFEIKACGFGVVMMQTSVIKRVMDKYGLPFFPAQGFGEDLVFCYRCRKTGITMYCDSSIKARHISYYEVGEETYQEGMF